MEETCSICLDEINSENKLKLGCDHILHKTCYEILVRNRCQRKCPLCRKAFDYKSNICSLCNEEMDMDITKAQYMVSEECGCSFHYKCLRRSKNVYCVICDRSISTEKIYGLNYLLFDNCYRSWIGEFGMCKSWNCSRKCNPARLGYCMDHNPELASNKSVILSFYYFTRFVYEENEEKRRYIFNEILEYMNRYHKFDDIDMIDFKEIQQKINPCNILHQ